MIKDQYVNLEIDYYEGSLDAYLNLFWSYDSTSTQIIPPQYFAYPYAVSNTYSYNGKYNDELLRNGFGLIW